EPRAEYGEQYDDTNGGRSPCSPAARRRRGFAVRFSFKLGWVGDLIHETFRQSLPGFPKLGRGSSGAANCARGTFQGVDWVMPGGGHARCEKQRIGVDIWRRHSNMSPSR